MSYSRAMRVFLALSLIVGAPFNSAFAGQVKFTKIDVPGATFGTQPAGINPQDDIVGYYRDSAFVLRGFLLSKGKVTTIDVPGAANGTVAAGINPRGDIVGSYFDSGFNSHGFLLSKGRVTFTPPGTTGGKRLGSPAR